MAGRFVVEGRWIETLLVDVKIYTSAECTVQNPYQLKNLSYTAPTSCYIFKLLCTLSAHKNPEHSSLFFFPVNEKRDFQVFGPKFNTWRHSQGKTCATLLGKMPQAWHLAQPAVQPTTKNIPTLPIIIGSTSYIWGHAAGSAVGWGTALQVGKSRVRFPMVSLKFFIEINLPAALWPWGWLSLQQKWVPGIFPGGKGGRCVGLTTLPPSCAECLKIWESQPLGTLRVCPGL